MRCEKEPLKEQPVRDEARTELVPHARRREAIGRRLHEVAAPHDIAARRRKPAARILDERARHDIHIRQLRRLNGIDELPIAVVDEYNAVRICRLNARTNHADVLDAERLTLAVTARTLHERELRPRRHDAVNAIHIHVPVLHWQFVIVDAELLERTDAFMRPANHCLHRVIGRPRD